MTQAALRGVSRSAYGNAYMLEVAAAIASHPKERFLQHDLVRATGVEKGLVATVVRRLEPSGLIVRLPGEGRERPFERTPSVFWESILRHMDEVLQSNQ